MYLIPRVKAVQNTIDGLLKARDIAECDKEK